MSRCRCLCVEGTPVELDHLFFDEPLSWFDARSHCQSFSRDLAVFLDADEATIVHDALSDIWSQGDSPIWIGGRVTISSVCCNHLHVSQKERVVH